MAKGWLDNYGTKENENTSSVSLPEGFVGMGNNTKGRNYSPAWGGQFQEGGEIPNAQKGKKVEYVESKNDPRYKAYQDSAKVFNYGLKMKDILKNAEDSDDYVEKMKQEKKFSSGYVEDYGRPKDVYDAIQNLKKLNGIEPKSIGKFSRDFTTLGITTGTGNTPLYKKPQQQVIVKPTTTKQTTKPKSGYWTEKDIPAANWKKFIKQHPGAIGMDPNRVDKNDQHMPIYADKNTSGYILQADGSKFYDESVPAGKFFDPSKHIGDGPIKYENILQEKKPVKAIQNNLKPAGLVQGDLDIDADAEIQPEVRRVKDWKYITKGGGGSEEGYINSPEDMDYYSRLKDFYTIGAGQGKGSVEITPKYQMGGNVYPVNYIPQAQNGIMSKDTSTPLIPYSNEYIDNLENDYLKLYNDPNTRMDDGYDAFYHSMIDNLPDVKRKAKGWIEYKPGTDIEDFTEDDGNNSVPTPSKNRMVKRVEDYEISDRPNTLEQDKLAKYMQQKIYPFLDRNTVSNKGYEKKAQMGGTIAGAPGFSYARTKGAAPYNGPGAKKTMASAQNGKEMQYYQQGLDFKPKSISQNGGWLDNYDVAQNGKQVEYGTPEYREAYNKGEVVTDQGVRSPIQLDEVVVSKKSPAPGFWKQSRDKYLEEHQDDDVLGAIGSVATYPLGLAQQAMMYGLTGKVQTPTEGMGIRKGMEGFPGAVLNAVVDPANLFGAGEISGLNKLAKQFLVKSNPIISTIPKALKYGLYKELGNAALHTAADNVAKATYKLPIVDKLYKDLAYKVGNQSSGWDRSIDDLKDIFSKNYEGGDNFTGYLGDDKQKRDLLKQYIYGNQPGFEQSSVPIRGLDKYVKKYGEMENFKLSTSKLAPSDVTNTTIPLQQIRNVNDYFGLTPHQRVNISAEDYIAHAKDWIKNNPNRAVGSGFNEIGRDNIAGHLKFFKHDPVTDKYIMNTQDIWKFTPEDYTKKWGYGKYDKLMGPEAVHADKMRTQNKLRDVVTNKQAAMMERAGKPFTLTDERIIDFNEPVPSHKQGGVIKDDRGQWDHPGEVTEIGSNEITMQGVPYDVLGVSDTGDTKLMKPGKNYKFKGKKVTEYPMAQNGLRQEQKGLQNLDNLTNFTNYNKPQPGGWLNKYN